MSGAEGSTDIPSWVKDEGYKPPRVGETGKEYARRVLDNKYGPGNWDRGTKSEYSVIPKWADRHFQNP